MTSGIAGRIRAVCSSCSCSLQYRYVACSIVLCVIYVEMSSRFGVAVGMIGGMVRENCTDTHNITNNNSGTFDNSTGSFCWSEDTKALVLGAYFYGYAAQFPVPFIAKRVGFLLVYRFWIFVSAMIQFSYPFIAELSVTLLIITQAIRGCLTGVMIAYSMTFIMKWSVGNESKVFLSAVGSMFYIGNGSGALLAGLTLQFGWQYYFYISGSLFMLAFIVHCVMVQESPTDSWFMSKKEKRLYKKAEEFVIPNKQVIKRLSVIAQGNYRPRIAPVVPVVPIIPEKKETGVSLAYVKNMLNRAYLWGFCIYIVSYNFTYYNYFNTAPFYLNKILNAGPDLISYIALSLSLVVAICTIIFSWILGWADKYVSWIKTRMLFTLVPMLAQVALFILLPFVNSIEGVVTVLACSAVASSTIFSGSVMTLTYELDPESSPVLMPIIVGLSQIGGFLGPILMARITYTEPGTENYDEVFRARWGYFFFCTSGLAAAGVAAVVVAYLVRPGEWVDKSKDVK